MIQSKWWVCDANDSQLSHSKRLTVNTHTIIWEKRLCSIYPMIELDAIHNIFSYFQNVWASDWTLTQLAMGTVTVACDIDAFWWHLCYSNHEFASWIIDIKILINEVNIKSFDLIWQAMEMCELLMNDRNKVN